MKCTFLPRFIAPILGLAVALSASAQIYQWKDKDGTTHFSDTPPPNQPNVQVQMFKRAQPPATDTEPALDEPEAESGKGNAELEKPTAVVSALKKSQAAYRDEEFRKRRAAAAEAREKAEKNAARAAQDEQSCQRARAQHVALNNGQRISRFTESGERKFLDDEERAAETERTKKLIEAFCGKD
ncbi:MAG: DUF4124 domain-containing protein [Betaproteobacteria bacterium]|nr:DUF4124 domain-containing protein [Betaproteobacteria bacterium]